MQKKTKEIIGLIVAALAICAVVWGMITLQQRNAPDTTEGSKSLTVTVVHGDETRRDFSLQTEAEFLGDALIECADMGVKGENAEYGLYILEVDGEAASNTEQTYWSISKDGTMLEVGADSQPIVDGEHYELTLTTW